MARETHCRVVCAPRIVSRQAGPDQMVLFLRLCFGAWCAGALHRENGALAARLRVLCKGVHDRLRDDKYLIGRQLHNHIREGEAADPAAGVS